MAIHLNIHIPETMDDWELYAMNGSDKAAADLFNASMIAVETIANATRPIVNPHTFASDVVQTIIDVCRLHRKFGALDTEPRHHACSVVCKAMLFHHGVDINIWDLNYNC